MRPVVCAKPLLHLMLSLSKHEDRSASPLARNAIKQQRAPFKPPSRSGGGTTLPANDTEPTQFRLSWRYVHTLALS